MLGNEASAGTNKLLLNPISAANTAAATSAWISTALAIGSIAFIAQVGALTGSIVWTIETASDDGGTGGAALTPVEGAFSTVTANSIQKRTIDANASKGYVRIVGTVVTGPALVGASIEYRPRNV
jgi:hypothetical protein